MRELAAIVLAALLLAASPSAADRLSKIAVLTNGDIARAQSYGISIAIVAHGKVVRTATFGSADTSTAFAVGSVTKMVTASAVLLLAKRGKLSLEDSVAKYFPTYSIGANITVRQLLNHTSGIPNYLDDAITSNAVLKKTTPQAILATMFPLTLDFAPGSGWKYSNTGYVMLGRIVELVSGLTLADFESRNIFRPLGMQHTGFAPLSGTRVMAPWDGYPGDWSWYYADGDLISTPEDLARFDIALMSGKLLGRDGFSEMQQTVPYATIEPGARDGLGLFVATVHGETIVGHHGGMPGFRADNEMVPARGFAIIVAGNGAYDTTPIVWAALQAYLPDR